MRNGVRNAAMGETVRLAALVLVFGLSGAMPGRSLGEPPADKTGVGQRVVPKHRNLALQNGGGKPARAVKPDIYRVEQVNRGWFLLKPDGGPAGWVGTDQVVTVEQAVAFFSNAIGENPRDPHNYAMRALVLLAEREDPQHALADCNEAIRLDPKDPTPRSIRGAVYSATQNYDKAITDFDEVVRLRPKDAASYHDRGAARMFQRDLDRAIADFNQAIQLNPRDAANFVSRAAAWLEKNQNDRAIADLNEAIRLDPESADAYLLRASLSGQKGEFDQAIADFTQIIKLDPQAPLPYEARGTAWRNKKEYGRAIADFNQAIRLNPNNAAAYIARSLAWRDQHDLDKAIADLEQAIRLDPENPEAYATRGDTWVEKKDYNQAITDYTRVIQLEPKNASAYCSRGLAHTRKQQYDKAIADLDRAIELDPKNTDALNGRAWFRATCPVATYRDAAQAVASATQACELTAWKEPGLIDTLAAAYAEASDFGAALKWQAKAIAMETDANEKTAYDARLQLYQAKQPYRDAKP